MLDDLPSQDAGVVAGAIRELERDAAVLATGRDAAALRLACDEVLELVNGIVVGQWPPDGGTLAAASPGPAMLGAARGPH
jgi:hypothetical protein